MSDLQGVRGRIRQRRHKELAKGKGASQMNGFSSEEEPDNDDAQMLQRAHKRSRHNQLDSEATLLHHGNRGDVTSRCLPDTAGHNITHGGGSNVAEPLFLRSMSETTFTCGCCYELMVQPTTLNCGHSFCRLCLAKWWKTVKKMTCPGCRQPWVGFPHINIILRNTMEKMFPSELHEREVILQTQESKAIMQEFEAFGQELEKRARNPGVVHGRAKKGFLWGVLTTLGVVFLLQLLLNWGSGDSEMLVNKPLTRWKASEVSEWLSQLGGWAANEYSQKFLDQKINGNLLFGLTEETDLAEQPFNISNSLHRRAILAALNRVKELGYKPPRDLSDYKTLYIGLATFLMYALKEFPRLTMTSMYIFHYDDVFRPFIHITCPVNHTTVKESMTVQYDEDIVWEQWAEFIPKFVFLPYYLIAEFSWEWVDVNFVPVTFVLANCVFLTMMEAKAIRAVWKMGVRMLTASVKKQANTLLFLLVSAIVWPLIPTVFCDLLFYISLYFSPLSNFYAVFLQ